MERADLARPEESLPMSLNRRNFCLRALAGLPLAVPAAGALEKATPEKLIGAALEAWDVPGAAVGVVREDRVEYLAGHGVRARGEKAPVTAGTLFPLGSCTKAFT